MISITCNNVSANTAMLCELEDLLEDFAGTRVHMRCFTHRTNLTTKGMLQAFKTKQSSDRDTEGEEDEDRAKKIDIEENGVRTVQFQRWTGIDGVPESEILRI